MMRVVTIYVSAGGLLCAPAKQQGANATKSSGVSEAPRA